MKYLECTVLIILSVFGFTQAFASSPRCPMPNLKESANEECQIASKGRKLDEYSQLPWYFQNLADSYLVYYPLCYWNNKYVVIHFNKDCQSTVLPIEMKTETSEVKFTDHLNCTSIIIGASGHSNCILNLGNQSVATDYQFDGKVMRITSASKSSI